MKNFIRYLGFVLTSFLMITALAQPAKAAIIGYDLSWTGASGFSLTGMFSFDDSLLGTGSITGSSLDSFMIEGFDGGSSMGTFVGTPENFNFDTTTELLAVGGNSFTSGGQRWNATGTDGVGIIGFESGSSGQSLYVSGSFHSASQISTSDSTLMVARKVPEPSIIALFGLGLLGLGFARRKVRS